MDKLKSRKFWLSVAAFLGGIGSSIAGIAMNDRMVTLVGGLCAALSAGIYAACEAYVDAAAVGSQNEGILEEAELLNQDNNN